MTKGRKPKADAQRRGGASPVPVEMLGQIGEVRIIESPSITKPAHIAASPLQSECWDNLVGMSQNFEPCDVPLLEAYCYWFSVLRQVESNTVTEDGFVVTLIGKIDEDGNVVAGSTSPNPDLRNAEKATNMLRQLADALQLTPTARDRAGLMRAMTKSTQADVVKKTLDGYEQFKKQQKALNAAK